MFTISIMLFILNLDNFFHFSPFFSEKGVLIKVYEKQSEYVFLVKLVQNNMKGVRIKSPKKKRKFFFSLGPGETIVVYEL